MQTQLEEEARQIVKSVSGYQYWATLDTAINKKSPLYLLQGCLQGKNLFFGYNVANAYVSSEEAQVYIEQIRSYYHQLYAASALFREFVADKEVTLDISVNSGHMSFIIAQAKP